MYTRRDRRDPPALAAALGVQMSIHIYYVGIYR